MSKFKPGDRVKIRAHGAFLNGKKGTVKYVYDDGEMLVIVRIDRFSDYYLKPSQLIKLKPKVKREPRFVWIYQYPDRSLGKGIHIEIVAKDDDPRWVKFVEVMEEK